MADRIPAELGRERDAKGIPTFSASGLVESGGPYC